MRHGLHTAQAFVFDFYGTLIEDDTTVPPMWRFLNDLGYNSHAELEGALEPNAFDGCQTPAAEAHDEWVDANWRTFLRLSGVPREDEESTLLLMHERRSSFESRAAPGVHSLVSLLREHGVAVGLCSNWESPLEPLLKLAGLPAFDAVVTSRECGARKPHPKVFSTTCEKLGVDPGETVFVGDSWRADIHGALRVGMSPVWIRHGRETRGVHHVLEVDSIEELEELYRRPPASGKCPSPSGAPISQPMSS